MTDEQLHVLEVRLIHVLFAQKHIQSMIESQDYNIAHNIASNQIETLEELLTFFKNDE